MDGVLNWCRLRLWCQQSCRPLEHLTTAHCCFAKMLLDLEASGPSRNEQRTQAPAEHSSTVDLPLTLCRCSRQDLLTSWAHNHTSS